MLVIEAIAVRGEPMAEPLRATFDQAGGTIGRAGASTLALPDPERRISRTHATIGFDQRGFLLTDTGSFNRLALNGRCLSGGHAYLKDGDTLTVGSYRLLVRIPGAAAPDRQRLPTPTTEEPAAANVKAALSSPASSSIAADPPASASPAEQATPHVEPSAAKADPPAAAADALPSNATKELDLIFKSRDARVEPYLRNDWIARPAVPESDALGLYPFFPLDSKPERIPEIDAEPPVLTSVWNPDDEEPSAENSDATEATVYAGAPVPRAVSTNAHDMIAQQLAAILRGAGVNGITPQSLEIIGRALRESAQRTSPRGRGFTTPIHQSGILAGVRGAFSGLTGRLSPHRLETWLKRKSPLDSLLRASH
jgi:predicted component of type VI protein secretion system